MMAPASSTCVLLSYLILFKVGTEVFAWLKAACKLISLPVPPCKSITFIAFCYRGTVEARQVNQTLELETLAHPKFTSHTRFWTSILRMSSKDIHDRQFFYAVR